MMFKCEVNSVNLKTRLLSPAAALAIALAPAIVLALLPERWTGRLRDAAAGLLRPGQRCALVARQYGAAATAQVKSHLQTAADAAHLEQELDRLKQENQQLAAQLTAARGQLAGAGTGAADDAAERLLAAQCVPARVLGSQARAFLARHRLLDVGSQDGIEPQALVVDWPAEGSPALIDRGDDSQLRPGQLVLSGRRVWGKIVQLGARTSAVRTATESGYRDLVQLVSAEARPGDAQRRPQGILEGTGEPLARVRRVEVTEPVSVGDLVCATSAKGVVSAPLLYGWVVRLQRPVGAAHWEIWVQPAVTADEPERVAVLRTELNPLRVARQGPIATDQ